MIRTPRALSPCVAVSLLLAVGGAPTGPSWAQTSRVSEVTIGGLAGTWTAPAGAARYPAVLIVAGSGPTDRDGNNPQGLRTDAYKQLAAALAEAGIASLRYDKRGVAASRAAATRESLLTVEVFARDAADVAAWVRARPEVSSVHIAGHSEGGLLALLAPTAPPLGSLILLTTPGRPLGTVLREQLGRQPLPEALQTEGMRVIEALEAGRDPGDVAPPLDQLFRPSVRPFLISVFTVDPARRLAARGEPVLVIGGGRDLQVTRADFEALAMSGAARLTVHWEPDMGHVLKAVRPDDPAQASLYTDPAHPLLPAVAARLVAWVNAHDGAR
jgi:hypothetical protein